jgi:hypothetical protein
VFCVCDTFSLPPALGCRLRACDPHFAQGSASALYTRWLWWLAVACLGWSGCCFVRTGWRRCGSGGSCACCSRGGCARQSVEFGWVAGKYGWPESTLPSLSKALFVRKIVPRSIDVSCASRVFIRCFCYHDLATTLCIRICPFSPIQVPCVCISLRREIFFSLTRCRSYVFAVTCILRQTTPAASRFLWPRANQPVAMILLAGP